MSGLQSFFVAGGAGIAALLSTVKASMLLFCFLLGTSVVRGTCWWHSVQACSSVDILAASGTSMSRTAEMWTACRSFSFFVFFFVVVGAFQQHLLGLERFCFYFGLGGTGSLFSLSAIFVKTARSILGKAKWFDRAQHKVCKMRTIMPQRIVVRMWLMWAKCLTVCSML